MAVLIRPGKGQGDDQEEFLKLMPDLKRCNFCDGEATAYWFCQRPVAVCRECATGELAALAADALVGGLEHRDGLIGLLERGREKWDARFWRAVACRLSAALRERRHPLERTRNGVN